MRDSSDRDLEQLFELDAAPGPARPTAHNAAIVAGALAGAGFGPPRGGGAGGGKLLLIAGGGIAVVAIAIVAIAWNNRAPTPVVVARPPPAPVVAMIAPPTEVAPPPPIAAPAAPAEIEMPAVGKRPSRPHGKPATPEDLLAEANAERAAHRWPAADALYARVVAEAPRSLAAQTALVASASLHLEHLGDAGGAARRFRAALAAGPHGALAEDARWGLAEAARATGDVAAERAALDDFLAHHAGSPLAPRARERRGAL